MSCERLSAVIFENSEILNDLINFTIVKRQYMGVPIVGLYCSMENNSMIVVS